MRRNSSRGSSIRSCGPSSSERRRVTCTFKDLGHRISAREYALKHKQIDLRFRMQSMSSQGQDAYDELKRSADVELRQRHADIGQRERDIAQLTLASDKKHEQAERLMSAAKHQKAIVEETMESLQEDRKYLGEQGITVMSGWGVLWDGVASLPSVQQVWTRNRSRKRHCTMPRSAVSRR